MMMEVKCHTTEANCVNAPTTFLMDSFFIIAIHPRVSVGMDAVGPCDRRSQDRMSAWVPMRQEVEFRLKRAVARAPKGPSGMGQPCCKAAAER